MSDKMMRRTLIVCAGVLVLCGLPMVVMAVVQRDVRMGLYGVMSLLFALSDVLQACIVRRPECPKPVVSVAFETHGDGADGTGHWVRIGTLKADTVQNGVIPDRLHHQGRHEILRVESFDGDVKAVLNESLTDNVLKQHYIDALSNADQLVVVPDGADTLVQTK